MSTLFAINHPKINKTSLEADNFLQIVSTIAKPPKSLYYLGMMPAERHPTLAIIGTRRPTPYGVEVTTRFSGELARQGIVIISGLASGVDALAHSAALDSNGVTIAVLGNSLPNIYPSSNRQLATRILASNGAIISEYGPDDDKPMGPWRFLERNRIVAGLADGILITKASARSGTLNTAAYALEQGKEVFVIPGNITSPMSAGCNLLIKQGATPVTCADDILQVIAPNHTASRQQSA